MPWMQTSFNDNVCTFLDIYHFITVYFQKCGTFPASFIYVKNQKQIEDNQYS